MQQHGKRKNEHSDPADLPNLLGLLYEIGGMISLITILTGYLSELITIPPVIR